ncbi:MAG: AraD1 family protein [Caldilineaceae bacterium]
MRLVQWIDPAGERRVGVVSEDGTRLQTVRSVASVYDLAQRAYRQGVRLEALVADQLGEESVEYAPLLNEKRLLAPLDHPDPAHFIISGTGLDHLGSAMARNAMHTSASNSETDSMKMFRLGLEGGKPEAGKIGSAPEWFYKGDGSIVVPPEAPLDLPPFALDGGEEAELVGLYLIGDDGEVLRIGYALGNEYADHILERQNYLYLAHSKLRQCSFGPEILLGDAPGKIDGQVRIVRNGATLWSGDIHTGEENMTHWLSNIEHHHFKYELFRRPGDIHAHYFGASALSTAAGIKPELGDIFEIESPLFGRPLRNPLGQKSKQETLIQVRSL